MLFVSFFPQLIAGPIVHHGEMMPQLSIFNRERWAKDVAEGMTLFVFGLFKKVVIADSLMKYVGGPFGIVASGVDVNIITAWVAVMAYTFQIYYDFSGYSDMALGLARMFGVHLPLNFNAPYKATSITDFWRRWHITLSHFLRDYIYVPLGGSRQGRLRLIMNLLITMLIGGLWHGANWTFLWWGLAHGLFLTINHLWVKIFEERRRIRFPKLVKTFYWGVTFFSVMLGWVLFRSESVSAAVGMYSTLFAFDGLVLPLVWQDLFVVTESIRFVGESDWAASIFLVVILFFTLMSPNCRDLFDLDIVLKGKSNTIKWEPTVRWAFFVSCLFLFTLGNMSSVSEFLYFQF